MGDVVSDAPSSLSQYWRKYWNVNCFLIFAVSATAYSQPNQLLTPLLSLMREGRMNKGDMKDGWRGDVGSKQTEAMSAA